MVLRKNMDKHTRKCGFRPSRCDYCGAVTTFNQLQVSWCAKWMGWLWWGVVKCAPAVAMYPADSFMYIWHWTVHNVVYQHAQNTANLYLHALVCAFHALCSQVTDRILSLLHRTIGRCVRSILCFVVKDVGRRCPDDWWALWFNLVVNKLKWHMH